MHNTKYHYFAKKKNNNNVVTKCAKYFIVRGKVNQLGGVFLRTYPA